MNRCVLLFTGGRKARLALALLREQRLDVTALAVRYAWADGADAEREASRMAVELRTVEAGREQFALALSPRRPSCAWAAPCGDCQAMQLGIAAGLARERRADFVATGDVLRGSPCRPADSFAWADREAGLEGRVLRPLSARKLPETEPEADGLVDRSKLLSLSGRSAKALSAAGARAGLSFEDERGAACRFGSRRTGERFAHLRGERREEADVRDLDLLEVGRHFLSGRSRIVTPASAEEDERLVRLARDGDWLVAPSETGEPRALVTGAVSEKDLRAAAALLAGAALRRARVPIEFEAVRKGAGERRRFALDAARARADRDLLRL